jgi:Leucine-rich repeat (LRR) protein
MTPEEEYDYQEAVRRIQAAVGGVELDLIELAHLTSLPPELASLTSLQSLNLSGCRQLSGDLSPLAALPSLQSLNLFACEQLRGDLSLLAGLTSLQTLNLSWCRQFSGDLSPLARLRSLQTLNLSNCGQLSDDLSPLAGLTFAPNTRPLRVPAAQRAT